MAREAFWWPHRSSIIKNLPDIRDTQLFSPGFNVFHGPGGYLAYLCNFDLLSLVS